MRNRFKLYRRHFRKALKGEEDAIPVTFNAPMIKKYVFTLLSIAFSVGAAFIIGWWSILFFLVIYFIGGVILLQKKIL